MRLDGAYFLSDSHRQTYSSTSPSEQPATDHRPSDAGDKSQWDAQVCGHDTTGPRLGIGHVPPSRHRLGDAGLGARRTIEHVSNDRWTRVFSWSLGDSSPRFPDHAHHCIPVGRCMRCRSAELARQCVPSTDTCNIIVVYQSRSVASEKDGNSETEISSGTFMALATPAGFPGGVPTSCRFVRSAGARCLHTSDRPATAATVHGLCA